MFKFVLEHLGLLLGLGLVLIASAVLPGRLRWYVLSAGLAVVAMRTYQLISADKRLKEADEERKKLRGTLEGLNGQRQQLQSELQQLNGQLDSVKQQKNDLAQRAEVLTKSGNDVAKEKKRLDKDAAFILQQDQKIMAEINSRQSALMLFEEAEQAYSELGRMNY
ncbi:MAG: hypothetical protein GXP08_15760 [Gammaproteobacteria bacterium]|nr:hypothetical protein [Gammaproteobacteria bacterium]